MAWSTNGRNARAEATADLIVSCSLHTADPGASGTDAEWSGGGYSRQVPAFGSASGGVVGLSTAMEFSGPSETNAAFLGLWGTGPTFLGAVARTSGDAASNAAGEYNVTQLNINADGTIS
jgi:hypothetical protein